jgi:hypothetical protein
LSHNFIADDHTIISLREKQVVLPPAGVFPLQTFGFRSKNTIYVPGDNRRFYQRRRRGARITWLESSSDVFEQVVEGGLDERLEEAYLLMENAKNEKAMKRFAALVEQARSAGSMLTNKKAVPRS